LEKEGSPDPSYVEKILVVTKGNSKNQRLGFRVGFFDLESKVLQGSDVDRKQTKFLRFA